MCSIVKRIVLVYKVKNTVTYTLTESKAGSVHKNKQYSIMPSPWIISCWKKHSLDSQTCYTVQNLKSEIKCIYSTHC